MTLPLIVALAVAAVPAQAASAKHYEQAVSGQWRLTAALDGADVTSLDEKEARRLVGRVLTIRKESVKFDDRTCGPSGFEAESVEPRMFVREQFHAETTKLGLPNPVTVVDLSCTSVFIKSENRLVIAWKGWFFDAIRVKR
jgi:hypothetical protein